MWIKIFFCNFKVQYPKVKKVYSLLSLFLMLENICRWLYGVLPVIKTSIAYLNPTEPLVSSWGVAGSLTSHIAGRCPDGRPAEVDHNSTLPIREVPGGTLPTEMNPVCLLASRLAGLPGANKTPYHDKMNTHGGYNYLAYAIRSSNNLFSHNRFLVEISTERMNKFPNQRAYHKIKHDFKFRFDT